MISLTLARQLRAAGLAWKPSKNDFFAIPDREMDDMRFVLTDMTVMLELIRGELAVTFHGAIEWALDHVMVAELVWIPTEAQLREMLEQRLVGEPQPAVTFYSTADGYRCDIKFGGQEHSFEAFGAGDAYGLALLHVLENSAENG